MNRPLTRRLDRRFVTVSQISALLTNGILLLASLAYLTVAQSRDWFMSPGWIAVAVFAVSLVLFTFVIPQARFRLYAFEVTEEELEIRSGWIWITNILVPMVRVQHVELERGPLQRHYGIAELKIVTAATTHRIRGLSEDDAEALKHRLGVLARAVDEDE
ncbi:membrane protein [Paenibacillus chitinolyticus]|uniref:PH domain-containing protein n=1 Tax=Paenibacillus chitinolyticus TaxID=79263 RepID=UPI0026E501C0|nr:PH domain-containing protein [Paenibacillus chitinolyticus]GKS12399.1 membrane protein [Paenibacillus chitinolyticus]